MRADGQNYIITLSAESRMTTSKKYIPASLRRLANLLKQGLITEEEHAAQRTRILNEL